MVFFRWPRVGLPGLNGFVSEFLCLIGAFQAVTRATGTDPGAFGAGLGPWFAFVAGTGMIIAAIYLLSWSARSCGASSMSRTGTAMHHGHGDGEAPERAADRPVGARDRRS